MSTEIAKQSEWRELRISVIRRAMERGWAWGRDPRGWNGDRLSLVSPRGTVFEFRVHGGRSEARRYHDRLEWDLADLPY